MPAGSWRWLTRVRVCGTVHSMSRHERFLSRAAAVAQTSTHPRWNLGAVIVRGSAIISTAVNVSRNSPHLLEGGPGTSFHAEECVLRRLTYQADRAEGCMLYVARVNRQGMRRLARPCQRCYQTITQAGIRSVVYTLDTPGYGQEKVYG